MFRLIIFFIALIFTSSGFAQNYSYHSVIDTNLVWQSAYKAGHDVNWTKRLSFEKKDTLLNNETYHILNRTYSSVGTDHTLSYFVREDRSKKVFLYQEGIEYLLYDFNALVGDTVWRLGSVSNSLKVFYYVSKIDSIEILGSLRKQFNIKSNWVSPSGKKEWKWIEGIGNSSYGLLNFNSPELGYHTSFCCALKNGDFCYSENSEKCISTTYTSSFYLEDVKFVPNPAQDFVKLEIFELMQYNVYDLAGKLRLSKPEGESQLDISSLERGIYFTVIEFYDNLKIRRKFVKF